ncbi:hypothetical protein N7470_005242 [Penicillium chermesinum]|nr:hypothetical protein N7470_005242 [Penicillium chermesinum]
MADSKEIDRSDHLIIVCCHAIYAGGPTHGSSEDEWFIEDFQRGETPTFVSHVKAGLDALAADNCGILIFSGYITSLAVFCVID